MVYRALGLLFGAPLPRLLRTSRITSNKHVLLPPACDCDQKLIVNMILRAPSSKHSTRSRACLHITVPEAHDLDARALQRPRTTVAINTSNVASSELVLPPLRTSFLTGMMVGEPLISYMSKHPFCLPARFDATDTRSQISTHRSVVWHAAAYRRVHSSIGAHRHRPSTLQDHNTPCGWAQQ